MCPLVIQQFALENGPVEIVDVASQHGNFPDLYVNVFQRVHLHVPMVSLGFSLGFSYDFPQGGQRNLS